MVVDTLLLQNGSDMFRVRGGKSVLIGSNSDDNSSFLLIPRNSEGTEGISV